MQGATSAGSNLQLPANLSAGGKDPKNEIRARARAIRRAGSMEAALAGDDKLWGHVFGGRRPMIMTKPGLRS
jgi:hypothetical protein